MADIAYRCDECGCTQEVPGPCTNVQHHCKGTADIFVELDDEEESQ